MSNVKQGPGQQPLEIYQAFMTGYVQRINNATLKVTIGGVRIGCAKYTRLAQINLKTRIITFSRYAIENVPERGRRYLVIHELAHVKEASHNKRFWSLVERFEPDYRKVGKSIQLAFSKNVKQDQMTQNPLSSLVYNNQPPAGPPLLARSSDNLNEWKTTPGLTSAASLITPQESADQHFYCDEDEFDSCDEPGILHGGSAAQDEQYDENHIEDLHSLPSLPYGADLFLFGARRTDSENI